MIVGKNNKRKEKYNRDKLVNSIEKTMLKSYGKVSQYNVNEIVSSIELIFKKSDKIIHTSQIREVVEDMLKDMGLDKAYKLYSEFKTRYNETYNIFMDNEDILKLIPEGDNLQGLLSRITMFDVELAHMINNKEVIFDKNLLKRMGLHTNDMFSSEMPVQPSNDILSVHECLGIQILGAYYNKASTVDLRGTFFDNHKFLAPMDKLSENYDVPLGLTLNSIDELKYNPTSLRIYVPYVHDVDSISEYVNKVKAGYNFTMLHDDALSTGWCPNVSVVSPHGNQPIPYGHGSLNAMINVKEMVHNKVFNKERFKEVIEKTMYALTSNVRDYEYRIVAISFAGMLEVLPILEIEYGSLEHFNFIRDTLGYAGRVVREYSYNERGTYLHLLELNRYFNESYLKLSDVEKKKFDDKGLHHAQFFTQWHDDDLSEYLGVSSRLIDDRADVYLNIKLLSTYQNYYDGGIDEYVIIPDYFNDTEIATVYYMGYDLNLKTFTMKKSS